MEIIEDDAYRALGHNERSAYYYDLLAHWRKTADDLKKIKDAELIARTQLARLTFADPVEGTNTHVFGENPKTAPKLKMTYPINRSLDQATAAAAREAIRARVGIIADNVIKVEYKLGVGDYKKLPDDVKLLLAETITAAPGTPGLEYVEGKV